MQNFFALFPFFAIPLLFLSSKNKFAVTFISSLIFSILSVLIGTKLNLFYLGFFYAFLFLFTGFYIFPVDRKIRKSAKEKMKRGVEFQKAIEKNKIILDEWDENLHKLSGELEEISKRYAFGESIVRNLEEKPILEEFCRSISGKNVLSFSFFKPKEKKWNLVFTQGCYDEQKWNELLGKINVEEKSFGQVPYMLIPLSETRNQTMVLVPIRLSNEEWGLLNFILTEPLSKKFLEEISTYSQLLGMGLQKVSLYQTVLEKSRRDGLTHLYLRRVFLERVHEEISFSKRYGTSFSLLMLDLDHFKKVNDTHGHLAGDAVLKNVADCLRSVLHPGVMICRYGGEEFAILIGLAPPQEVMQDAERIRKAVSELNTSIPDSEKNEIKITVSVGVTHYLPDAPNFEELIRRADMSLYKAKKEGRNRVIEWQAS